MQYIALIGCGLMGGSLGLALRTHRPDVDIVGWDGPGTLATALKMGAISRSAESLEDAVSNADLIVLAAPLSATVALFEEIGPMVREGVWIHDLCSVKQPVAQATAKHLPHCHFVGGHPMTGSEKSGIRHADAALYENATYILCPDEASAALDGYVSLQGLLRDTGARLLEMTPEAHDRVAARVSHLPQILSVLLVNL
ncbi:MAG: prephenate dehydrogenase/arogenate dehydrogenase family protein, partial [Bacteroidota bacterium]|nr:prephenate dehydrogenase/arogenate dehydrogenase family protein [Bacteroidota bacterium]